MIAAMFSSSLPAEFIALGEQIKPSPLMRFLYGGITEEILLRFGLMTLVIWVVNRLFKSLHSAVYWTGILVASVIFAIAHLPIVFLAVSNPSVLLILYIILGNSLGGIVFGWLYWKKGLEAAFVAHLFSHVILLAGEQILKPS